MLKLFVYSSLSVTFVSYALLSSDLSRIPDGSKLKNFLSSVKPRVLTDKHRFGMHSLYKIYTHGCNWSTLVRTRTCLIPDILLHFYTVDALSSLFIIYLW